MYLWEILKMIYGEIENLLTEKFSFPCDDGDDICLCLVINSLL